VGAMIGSLIAGPLMNLFSRKKLFLLADIIGGVGTLINLDLSLYLIIIGRVIMGISIGINSAGVPLYIK
jgi:SP family galactose:H+ symporter-like MFS transporter